MRRTAALMFIPLLVIAGCKPENPYTGKIPGDGGNYRPYAGIGVGEKLRFSGTEPFWGGEVIGGAMTYKTAETPDGQTISVARFEGRGGLSYSGMLNSKPLALVITPEACSDGMSDRSYPFAATLQIGNETRKGCAWSDSHPVDEPEAP